MRSVLRVMVKPTGVVRAGNERKKYFQNLINGIERDLSHRFKSYFTMIPKKHL